MNICTAEWEVLLHLNVLQCSLPRFDIGPITARDNAAVCCFRLYWTEDVPLTLDPPHETKAVRTAHALGFRLNMCVFPVNLKSQSKDLTKYPPEMSLF